MATKEKSPKELGEIMSAQLSILSRDKVSSDDVKTADSIANMAGKIMKLSALELAYAAAQKRKPGVIPSLTR
jgi:hypothetical protein